MFAIERSETTGPRGGKRRGYCLAWRGPGFPPFGMGRRSGWYLRRPDAEDRARVMNEAWRRDLARPVRDAVHKGDGAFLVRLPDGGAVFIQTLQPMPEGERAAYLAETYGKRAHLFFIAERRPMNEARIRAMDARDIADIGPPSVNVPSAAALILGKLTRGRA